MSLLPTSPFPLRASAVWAFCALLLLAASPPAISSTIYWGSAVNDRLYDSYGNPLDDSFIFELGTFGDFVPTDDNLDFWLENWKVLDRVSYVDGGWDPDTGFFSSSFSLLHDGTSSNTGVGSFVFSPGEQAYIWAYNSQTLNLETSEWALITNNSTDGNSDDDWIIPALPLECGCGGGDESLEWRLSTATQPDFGGINDAYGPGNVSDSPSSFTLQTAILPEPGGVLLLLSAASFLGLRRRRSRA